MKNIKNTPMDRCRIAIARHSLFAILCSWMFLLLSGSVGAQGTLDDYRRAYGLREKIGPDMVYYSNVNAQWVEGQHAFWYIRHTPEGDYYVLVDADKKQRSDLFDREQLSAGLAQQTGKEVDAQALRLQQLQVSGPKRDTLCFVYNNHRFQYLTRKNSLTDLGLLPTPPPERHWMEVDDEKGNPPVPSPDGRYEAFIRSDNVFVRDLQTGEVRQLSIDGTQGNYYSSFIKWSPDSRKVASCRIRPVEKRYVYYVESSPDDQFQPKLHKQEYAKPGDELPYKVPCIYDVETGQGIIPSDELFSNQYELYGPEWDADGQAITFEYNERGHQVYRVLELSASSGKVRTLIEETAEKYVNYSRIYRYHLHDGRHIIWSSERDNYNHLYLYDRQTAGVEHQITRGEWYVREVLHVDEEAGLIYFSANGMEPDEDPYLLRYYRIGLDGENLTCLTPEEGMHHAVFSSDMSYLVDTYSLVNTAPTAVLRSAEDGKVVMELEKADISQIVANGWQAPEVFTAKGRDGQTDMWGVILRPTNFDPSKSYPVIEYIYQGPGDQYVPKAFMPYNRYMTPLAELGFIVVMVDGMGTSFRSRSFEDICYKNLRDAGLPDHIAWIRAAAEKYPYMDLDRVGIYGCSAGGQESMTAILDYPDFYHACFSACGCHDNRMDKIWWNEQWLGYPIGEQYVAGSNVVNAHKLRRPLMLLVGEIDDNVDPASTMQVVNALEKAGCDFELVVIPGAHHTMGEDFGDHKRYDFFVRNLMGVNPPSWYDLTTNP